MTLVKVNNRPFGNLFNELLNDFPTTARSFGQDFFAFPQTNIHETPEAYHVELNAPGRSKEDFNICGTGLLTISFERKRKTHNRKILKQYVEFEFKSFKRSFSIDEKIDVDGIQAMKWRVEILLPKKKKQNKLQTNQYSPIPC
jgi:HSP20 family protein